MLLSKLTHALVFALKHAQQKKNTPAGDTIAISRTVSELAVLYEKIRTAIEYREEHLLRRAAIERIIKRRLILNENGRGIAEYLVREILWAKYLPENSINTSQIEDVQKTIDKYLFIRNEIVSGRSSVDRTNVFEWLISCAAAEVEEKLAPNPEREAFINFIFQYYKDKVFLRDEKDDLREIQVYIAVHRAFANSNDDYIRFCLLKLSFSNLVEKTWKSFQNDTREMYQSLMDIDHHLKHPIGQKMARALKKEMAPFLILRDVYEESPDKFETVINDKEEMEKNVERTCHRRYDEIKKRLARAGTRSIIYIFITKMVFALGLEYPYERYIIGNLNEMALGINTLFPPFLMFLALLGNAPPGEDNTKRIINRINEIAYNNDSTGHKIILTLHASKRRPLLMFAFSLLYVTAFVVVFGGIVWGLTLLHFSLVSQMIFVFFITVVLFFAYRIRQTGMEYTIARRESFLSPVADFFLLPILNVGKWLSNEVARFNFFIAIFDYLIEAPFKTIFEVFEEWFSFMRRQKEEIL
ncbi:MAG: hypothetical protein UU78_C0033G0004 [Candidatus Roizmanbacteria bacterium GW2011_GWC2_41_7]|uniref:Uncharacterized protein n=1 Tax=Candidatus Roizmanbacteria bacterium GW2011_GWC2_41_7 TaxID=1618487 RepID=A0A0G0ZHZ6_9BACT|nr:MAG: hypothetical protein UU78_C0033G0004 [Candidatus Roizmanbacteria bacterium GW2011_GWC2_41_7]